LIQLVTRLKSTDDVNIHEELNQEFHQAITELVQEQARSASSNSVAENIKYNHFIQEINVAEENGIWLK
ncbi:lipoprotein, partial [Providencia rettgeri]